MKPNPQSGVALVITLILLSVITFMAVTFLVVSRHEGAQVNSVTQQSNAKFAAEAALEQAKGQLMAQMLIPGSGSAYNMSLLVSTNYITTNYAGTTNLTDVSYNGILAGGLPQMLNNLLILPRPPVFIVTNKSLPNNLDFRYWLDLNRNGVYDTNGAIVELDANSNPVTNVYTGDPEWVGVLNRPDFRHSSSNFFVSRYCFIALPIGNSLDINYIHNQAKQINPTSDGYLRNQGVGSWEINLAAFLNALNTNYWGSQYAYVPGDNNVSSMGPAFVDAASIVQYRYNKSYTNLANFASIFGASAGNLFGNDFIDGYCYGPVMTNIYPPTFDSDFGLVNSKTWSGADNPNSFFTTQDLFGNIPFQGGNPANSFTNHLYSAGLPSSGGIPPSTYDRYTYYRLLSQMSFGSAAESSPAGYPQYPAATKLNLNYMNVGGVSATNFIPWTPLQFFTNAADRMLKTTFPNPILVTNGIIVSTNVISITNIPIYPANLYTPAVHRILQLAANIYDATTNKTSASPDDFDYPSVFRPLFAKKITASSTNVYIIGYLEVTNTLPNVVPDYLSPNQSPKDLRRLADLNALQTAPNLDNVYGAPYVIGVKRGFPNFNQFSTAPITQITRKMEMLKPSLSAPVNQTNVQYIIGISNLMAVECWNSYLSNYNRGITIYVTNEITMVLTNELGVGFTNTITNGNSVFYSSNTWSRSPLNNATLTKLSFKIPLSITNIFLADSVMQPPILNPNTGVAFQRPSGYPAPQWILSVTNRLRVVMMDQTSRRIIDYVQLSGLDTSRNLTADLQPALPGNLGLANIWDTNRYPSGSKASLLTYGMVSQIGISSGSIPITDTQWSAAQLNPLSPGLARTKFSKWLNGTDNSSTNQQLPFIPTAKYSQYTCWQANDPLVHYLASDLIDQTQVANPPVPVSPLTTPPTNVLKYLGVINYSRYQPWSTTSSGQLSATTQNLAYKDPLITRSDDWQFPTNRFPNIGWLGRVHRGTPWQTVYLKSTSVDPVTWKYWSGNSLTNYFGSNDPLLSQPTSDWMLMDLFTTAPNDNASHGQLSINQGNVAAWAAVLGGVCVVSNSSAGFVPVFIDPTSTFQGSSTNMVQYFVDSINNVRSSTNTTGALIYPGGAFANVGQILSVPQLTVNSPYLNPTNAAILNDAAYERIPQQILSLLRVGTPRYVIFAYGQSLKPADHSIVQSGPFFGMCTNYQITGEMATRTVIRFDNFPPQAGGTHAVVESFNVLGPE